MVTFALKYRHFINSTIKRLINAAPTMATQSNILSGAVENVWFKTEQ